VLFKDVSGQLQAKQMLQHLVLSDRIPHALLLSATAGNGSVALAHAFVQFLFCQNRSETDACCVCSACSKNNKLIHPDVHFSFPAVGAKVISSQFLKEWRTFFSENIYAPYNLWLESIKAENKQGNITAAECSDIHTKLNMRAFEGGYKCLIMWLPEYLGKEGNRLLKLLEEPPEKTIFILVTENEENILQTILSRCQRIRIPPLNDTDLLDALLKSGIAVNEAHLAVQLAEGNFNTAMQLAENKTETHVTFFLEWMRNNWLGDGLKTMSWIEKISPLGREWHKRFITYALHFFHQLLRLHYVGENGIQLQAEELKTAIGMVKVISPEHIDTIAELLNKMYIAVERNGQPKIIFLDASIQIHKIIKEKSGVN